MGDPLKDMDAAIAGYYPAAPFIGGQLTPEEQALMQAAAPMAAPATPPLPAPVSPAVGTGEFGDPAPRVEAVAPLEAPQAPQSASPKRAGVGLRPAADQAAAPMSDADIIREKLSRAYDGKPKSQDDMGVYGMIPSPNQPVGALGGTQLQHTAGSSQTKLTPKAKAAYDEAMQHAYGAAEATKAAGDLQADTDVAVGQSIMQRTEQLRQHAQQMAEDQMRADEHLGKLRADIDARYKAWSDESQTEFKGKATPITRVAGAIAAAFGAFGAAMTGSKNFAQDTLDSMFEREYDEWKRGIGAKRDALTVTQQMFNETSAMFKDRTAAKLVMQANFANLAASQVEQSSYLNKDKIGKARATADMEMVKANAAQRAADGFAREAVTYSSSNTTASTPATQKPRTVADDVVAAAEAAATTDKAFGPRENDRAQADKVLADVTPTVNMVSQIGELLDLADSFTVGSGVYSSSDVKRQYKAKRNVLFSPIMKALTGTGMSDTEYERKMDELFSESSMTSGATALSLRTSMETMLKSALHQIGTVDPRLSEQIFQRLTRTFPGHIVESIRSGQLPTAEGTKKQAEASGMRNVR